MFKHLKENQIGYFEHLLFTLKVAAALIIHGIVPCLFVTYASDKLSNRNKE